MAGTHANATADPAPGPFEPRFRRVRRGLLASIFTIALLTLGLETYLRVSGHREDLVSGGVNRTNRRWMELLAAGVFEEVSDPVRHYAMRPGVTAEIDGWAFRVTSHRTRGEEFSLEKPPGERRLVCLGDSFAFGLWADEDQTLVGHLARMASEAEAERGSDTHWRAINLGVPGYHSGQQQVAFETDGLALDPDAVVLYFNTNDIVREGMFLSEDLGALYANHVPLPTWLKRRLWDTSYLYGWIAHAYASNYASIPAAHLDPRVPWAHVRADNQEATASAIGRIAALCAERDIPLFFVNQPLLTWSGELRREDWPVLPLVRWAEDLRAGLGLPGVNLLEFFREPDPDDPDGLIERYIADETVQAWFAGERDVEPPADPDFHFTGEGYARIAEVCYPLLRAEGILP